MAKSESASQKLQAEIERLKSDNEKLEDKNLALQTKVASKDRYKFYLLRSLKLAWNSLISAKKLVTQTSQGALIVRYLIWRMNVVTITILNFNFVLII